jgi:hypothetical protein
MKPEYVYRERGTGTWFRFYHAGFDRRGCPVYSGTVRCKGETVFNIVDYRPSPMGRPTPRNMSNDIVSFAISYVERPGEFDRSPSDREQVCAAWWRRTGDMLSSGTESRRERA